MQISGRSTCHVAIVADDDSTYDDWTVRYETRDAAPKLRDLAGQAIKGLAQPVGEIAIARLSKSELMKMVLQVPINLWIPDDVSLVV